MSKKVNNSESPPEHKEWTLEQEELLAAWEAVKTEAFEKKTDWETKLSAAEEAEAVVADSEEPTEEQKNSAIELRKVADEAFKVQDDLFAKKLPESWVNVDTAPGPCQRYCKVK